MLQKIIVALILVFSLSYQARADAGLLTIDLAQHHVDITTGFNGAHVILFGMKERPGDVAIVVRGPKSDMVVRRKQNTLGAWVNRKFMKFRNVPVYYDFAVSKPVQELADADMLLKQGIGLNALRFEPDTSRDGPRVVERFQEALIRNKQQQGLYPLKPRSIEFLNENFFKTVLYVPANVPRGQYTIETFLFQDGQLVSTSSTNLTVAQVGVGAKISKFSIDQSLTYGLFCVLFAVFAGWLSNAIRKRV